MTVRDGFSWTAESWGTALRSTPLSQVADHFFTTRQLRLRGPSEEADWATTAATIGVEPRYLLRLNQVHGRQAVVVRRDDPAARDRLIAAASEDGRAGRPEADILVSDDPAVALAIQVADCAPLLMADRRSGAVAGVHAGWRGTVARAAAAAIEVLRTRVRDNARGPGGRPRSEHRRLLLRGRAGPDRGVRGGRVPRGDRSVVLAGRRAARCGSTCGRRTRDQLVAAGVRPDDIHQSGLCTASHPQWFASYRRDGPGTGRIAAVIRTCLAVRSTPSRGSPGGPLPC